MHEYKIPQNFTLSLKTIIENLGSAEHINDNLCKDCISDDYRGFILLFVHTAIFFD